MRPTGQRKSKFEKTIRDERWSLVSIKIFNVPIFVAFKKVFLPWIFRKITRIWCALWQISRRYGQVACWSKIQIRSWCLQRSKKCKLNNFMKEIIDSRNVKWNQSYHFANQILCNFDGNVINKVWTYEQNEISFFLQYSAH